MEEEKEDRDAESRVAAVNALAAVVHRLYGSAPASSRSDVTAPNDISTAGHDLSGTGNDISTAGHDVSSTCSGISTPANGVSISTTARPHAVANESSYHQKQQQQQHEQPTAATHADGAVNNSATQKQGHGDVDEDAATTATGAAVIAEMVLPALLQAMADYSTDNRYCSAPAESSRVLHVCSVGP